MSNPIPGWYPDPAGSPKLRWWDGGQWTDQFQPDSGAQAPSSAPGGFPGDKQNAFTAEGRTKEQNAMFSWLSRLLHWRKGNEVISKGKQTHFIPFKGIYVLARTLGKRHVLTIMNGTSKSATMPVARYAEVIGDADEVRDVLTGRTVSLQDDVQLGPRETLVVEWSE